MTAPADHPAPASAHTHNAPLPSPRHIRWLAAAARLALGLMLGLWLALAGAWALLHTLIVPRVDHWREPLAAWTGRMLGAHVEIGHLSAQRDGLLPTITAEQLRLAAPDAPELVALRLAKVELVVSARSLLRLGVEAINAQGLSLHLREGDDGLWRLGPWTLAGDGDGSRPRSALEWVLDQPWLSLQDAQLWMHSSARLRQDALAPSTALEARALEAPALQASALERSAPQRPDLAAKRLLNQSASKGSAELARFTHAPVLTGLELHWRGGRWQRQLRGQGHWGAALAGDVPSHQAAPDLQLMADLHRHWRPSFTRATPWLRGWRTQWFADVRLPDGQLFDFLADFANAHLAQPLPALQARGRLRLWARGLGSQLEQATLDVALADVAVQQSDVRMAVPALQTRAHWQRRAQAQHVQLELPLDIQATFNEYAAAGHIANFSAQWSPDQYRIQTHIQNAQFIAPPDAQIPSFANINAHIDAQNDGGRANIHIQNGQLHFPGIFENPSIDLDKLQSQLHWKITPQGALEIQVDKTDFANADAAGFLTAHYKAEHFQQLGQLDLQGEMTRARGEAVHRYLPLAVDGEVRDYLRHAISKGQASKTTFITRGHLQDFPFKNNQGGEFSIQAHLSDVDYDYLPSQFNDGQQWPALKQLSGLLKIQGTRFSLENVVGHFADYPHIAVQAQRVDIADFDADRPLLTLDAQASGPLSALVQAASAGAVGELTAGALAHVQATGGATLELGLAVPLSGPEQTAVTGAVHFGTDAAVQWAAAVPRVEQLTGAVRFSQHGFHLDGVAGRALGARVAIEGGLALAPSAHTAMVEKVILRQGSPTYLAETRAHSRAGVHLRMKGDFQAQALAREAALPAVVRQLGRGADGQAAYTVHVFVPTDGSQAMPHIAIASDLRGLRLHWPAPFHKEQAASLLPLRLQLTPIALNAQDRAEAAPALATHLQLSLGHAVHLQYVFDEDGAGRDSQRVHSGLWHIDTTDDAAAPLPLPSRGVVAHIRMPKLNADAWLEHARRLARDDEENAANNNSLNASHPDGAESINQWLPSRVALNADALIIERRRIAPVHVRLSRVNHIWGGAVHSNFFSGLLQYHAPSATHPNGLIHARLDHLHIPPERLAQIRAESPPTNVLPHAPTPSNTPSSPPSNPPFAPEVPLRPTSSKAVLGRGQPLAAELAAQSSGNSENDDDVHTAHQSLPDLDITVGALRVADARLGALRLIARNRREEGRTFWALDTLELTWPHAQLRASGTWGDASQGGNAPALPLTDLSFELTSRDTGAWLHSLGADGLIAGGAGTMRGRLSWAANPLTPDWSSMAGHVRLDMGRGRFLKVDPGAARLLSVLSLQSLARRLTLDFSDVFLQGFAFDDLQGDVRITAGQAFSENLHMRGLAAAVALSGSADLLHETQQLRVVVTPKISASGASLAAAAVNPVLGLGTLIAQWLLGAPLSQAATLTFDVTGTWTEPEVTQIPTPPRNPSP